MNQKQQVGLSALYNQCVVLTMAYLAKTMGVVEQLKVWKWMTDKQKLGNTIGYRYRPLLEFKYRLIG